ncbi:helix-turn-helix domain-containing protein [Kibdelosporangium aridum]|uniref:helix-turn-helix domain-containing protein n=1 Tax=Kibdelosporangium aridum TaxID=2030 RepID=UPI0035E53E67
MAIQRKGLAQRRAAAGFTQESLAEHLNVDRTTVARWEIGELTPLPLKQPALAKALAVTLDRLVELLHDGADTVDASCSGVPVRARVTMSGAGSVAEIRATAQAFQTADRQLGGGVLYESVAHYLSQEIGPRLLDPAGGPDAADLFSAAASLTEIAGWMSHDSGQDDRAHKHFNRAYRLAKAADDATLSGNACASMAHLAVELDQADDALRIASVGLGCTPATEGTKQLIARLHAMRARAFAIQVNRTSCINALKLAERVLQDASDEGKADWIAVFDEASLASEASLCFMQLAEYSEAELRAKEVIRLRSGDRVRSRAFGQLTLANVLLRAGRVEEAAMLGQEVCMLTRSLSSARVTRRIHDLAGALQAVSSGPEVTEFVALVQPTAVEERRTTAWPV